MATEADLAAEMLWISGEGLQCLGHGVEQDGVTCALFWKAIAANSAGSLNTT